MPPNAFLAPNADNPYNKNHLPIAPQPRLQDLSTAGEVKIYRKANRLPQYQKLSFESLCNLRKHRPEPFDPEQLALYPYHTQTVRDIAEYVISECDGDFQIYADKHGTFTQDHVGISRNWDWEKCDPIALQIRGEELVLRDGRHRSLIITTKTLLDEITFQPVTAQVSVFEVANRTYQHNIVRGTEYLYEVNPDMIHEILRSIISDGYTSIFLEIPESELEMFKPPTDFMKGHKKTMRALSFANSHFNKFFTAAFQRIPSETKLRVCPITITASYETYPDRDMSLSQTYIPL